jgi:hypothetical protein
VVFKGLKHDKALSSEAKKEIKEKEETVFL